MASDDQHRDEDKLAWAISAAINGWERGGPRTISEHVAAELWPLILEGRQQCYQQGRADAAEAIEGIPNYGHPLTAGVLDQAIAAARSVVVPEGQQP